MKSSHWREQGLSLAALKHAAVRASVFTVSSQVLKFFLNMGVTIWLAHLLLPSDFGLIAMAMIVVNLFALFKDAGFALATVQQASVTHAQVSLLFYFNALLGFILAICCYFSAPLLVFLFSEPKILEVMQVLSLVFLVGGLGIQHEALMRRKMRFKGLVGIELVSLLAGVIFAIYLASAGYTYWAMVWMQVLTMGVRVVLVWLFSGWLPSLPAWKVGVRQMVTFGGQVTLANTIQYVSRQSDQFLLGWSAGAHVMGLYSTAMQMLMLPIRQILAPLTPVAQVTLSRLQDDPAAFRRAYLLFVRVVAYASMPLMAVLAVLAEPVVVVFLGEQWLEAVPLVRILAVTGWILAVNNTMSWVFTARGQGKRMLKWNLVMAPLFVIGFVCGLPWGAEGVAWGFFFVIYISRYAHYCYTLQGTAVSMADLWYALCWPVCLSLVLATVAIMMHWFLLGWAVWLSLLMSMIVILMMFILILVSFKPIRSHLLEVWELLQGARKKSDR